jgi:hypothetical protein
MNTGPDICIVPVAAAYQAFAALGWMYDTPTVAQATIMQQIA